MPNAMIGRDTAEEFIPATRQADTRQAGSKDILERAIAATNQGKSAATHLTRNQKAAIIVRLLLPDASDLPLADLEPPNMAHLVRAMAGLSFVDEPTILQVVQEFLDEFESLAIYFKPGIDGALETLYGHIDDDVTAILAYTPTPDAPDDPWVRILDLEIELLTAALIHETPQIIAVFLAKLPAVKAAEILGAFDSDLARAVTIAATQAGRVKETTIQDIGVAIVAAIDRQADQGALGGRSGGPHWCDTEFHTGLLTRGFAE